MGKSRQAGFTLIELMVTLAVMAIVLAIAVPSFASAFNTTRLSSAANEMVAALQTARMESVRRNRRGVVCLSANPDAAAPSCSTASPTGWITYLDVDSSGTYNASDVLLRVSKVRETVVVNGSALVAGQVTFRSDGLARDSAGNLLKGAIDVCISTTQPLLNARHVCIGGGSRVSVQSATDSACATTPANAACDL